MPGTDSKLLVALLSALDVYTLDPRGTGYSESAG